MSALALAILIAAATTRPASLSSAADAIARGANLSGVVLIARDGRPVFEHAYGLANRSWSVPNTVDTRFELASLTKAFTGMAVAQLAASGRLNLDDPVTKYVPNAPQSWEKITIDELLTHTSGLPNNAIKDFQKGICVPYTPDELIGTFRDRPLAYPPGTSWAYTNTEYYLLAYIIQKVSGESYGDFLQSHIFTPLGMKNSGFASTRAVIPQIAEGYTPDNGTLLKRDYFDRSLEIGAGGVYSNLHDLMLWDKALNGERLLPRRFLDRIFAASNKGHYGYGWFVERQDGKTRTWHEGSDPGYGAFIIRRPDDHLLIVVLSNIENSPVRDIAKKLEVLALAHG